MLGKTVSYFALSLSLLLGNGSGDPLSRLGSSNEQIATLERMIVATGEVKMDLDLDPPMRFQGGTETSKLESFHFEVSPNSFFTIRILNDALRGLEPGSMGLIWDYSRILPEPLRASANQLVIEKIPSNQPFSLFLRDGRTGFRFLDIEANLTEYDTASRLLNIKGKLFLSEELATSLGRPADAGAYVGEISMATRMYPIEVTTLINGATKSSTLVPRKGGGPNGVEGSVPGPDIVVGDIPSMLQAGSASGQVGLGMATTSCNNGDQPVHFFALPNTDHSVVSQNLYRMSGGATNDERFEQIGEAWVKHTFGADQGNDCNFGCTPYPDQTALGVGCSDPYGASENATYSLLGSRAWINPFTGAFPSTPANHTGHVHTGTSHRVLVNASDLNTTLNTGATYYAEAQYDTPQEYAWCQAHPGQCNMYNNATYRRYNVTGTTSFTFSAVGSAVRMTPATNAWSGATSVTVEPDPGVDGRAFLIYKVSGPNAGLWHYEYAIHNQNLDRSIQSFTVPLGCGITISNVGFHFPPNHPGFANDGTVGNTGFKNAPWNTTQTATDLTWNTDTFAGNQNANAIRFATMYNFRFDSDRPPQAATGTIGFFKTGSPMTVAIQAPSPDVCAPSPTPTATPIPTSTPTPTPTPPPTVSISGAVIYCSDPSFDPMINVGLDLTGTASGSTLSDGSGNYQFSPLPLGGDYVITPSKDPLKPGSTGIDTIDVVATQRHFLNIVLLPPGCRSTAADVNGDHAINTVDVIAIQRFFLGLSTGTANTGQYQFSPPTRSYSNVTSDQTGQDYDGFVFGDVASPFTN